MNRRNDTIGCQHFTACSGCLYDSCHKPPEIFERAKAFFDEYSQINLRLKTGPVRYWRTRAKLAVRHNPQQPNEPIIGLFKRGSHEALSIPNCQVHHPSINEAILRLLKAFKTSDLTAYEERLHRGDLRYIQCLVERSSGKVQLTLVLNRTGESEEWNRFCKELFTDDFWHSIWINYNDRKDNVIFGQKWEKVIGNDYIWEKIYGHSFAFGPNHFGQANLALYETLIEDMDQHLPKGLQIADLYSGIGVIGTCLAPKSKSVSCIEIQTQARPYFEASKSQLEAYEQKKLSYLVAPAEKSLQLLHGLDVCIVDPPRKGLGAKCIDELLSISSLKQLIYISCDWNSLEKDALHILKKHPYWKIQQAYCYLFFPGTNHIETAVFYQKVKQ